MGSSRQSGFTVIELVVVLVVLATLAMLAMPLAEIVIKRTKERELKAALVEIRQAIDAYKRAGDKAVITKIPDRSGYPPTLEILVEGVPDATIPGTMVYFLRRIPRDPFAKSQAGSAQMWGLRSYASSASAPEAGDDVYDVYSLASGVGLNGLPYREW